MDPVVGKPSYEPSAIRDLFDGMAATYGLVNVLSSFGFCLWWRRACVHHLPPMETPVVVDLMAGMGECWPSLRSHLPRGQLSSIDLSGEMTRRARQEAPKWGVDPAQVLQGDALESHLASCSADAVICAFGLKTLDASGQVRLAREIHRLLKPGGHFSVIEISTPRPWWLRLPYMAYLDHLIPWIGAAFLGNPSHYRMLGRYTRAFGDCHPFQQACQSAGLEAVMHLHFGGCASSVAGFKPASSGAESAG